MSTKAKKQEDRSVLAQELEYFEQNREEFLKHYDGQFALVKGSELHGTFTKEVEAFEAGVELFGTAPFLIKQVLESDTLAQVPALTLGLISAHP